MAADNAAAIAKLTAELSALTARVDTATSELSPGDAALNVRDLDVAWLVLCGERVHARADTRRACEAHGRLRAHTLCGSALRLLASGLTCLRVRAWRRRHRLFHASRLFDARGNLAARV
jgi:hypothetical protein